MASPGNRHCANCIGTLSFPVKSGHAVTPRYDRRKFVTLSVYSTLTVTQRIARAETFVHSAFLLVLGWRRGAVVSGVRRMNEVNARRARLVLGWVTVLGRVYHLGM